MNSSTDINVIIRQGVESDCDEIFQLIKDLAVYEGMLDQVKITAEDLKRDAFLSTPPVVYTIFAEITPLNSDKKIAGYAIYYKTYSTWSGQAIHLEDFFVRPEYRYKGIGDKIFRYLAKIADEGNYARLSWECIDWNESAMKFYKKYGAEDVTVKDHWHSYRFVNETVRKLASE